MKLPNFLCIGVQKAGTTSFQDILYNHPNVYLSSLKEIKFFHRDEHYAKGKKWYAEHFVEAQPNQLIGDITPDYILYNCSAKRIFETFGLDIKIIVLLRHPVDRAFSQFNFHRSVYVEKETEFKKIIDNYSSLDTINESFINWHTPAYYIERGLYYNQINRFLEYFPKEKFHFAIFEELFGENKEAEFLKLYKFLGIDPIKQQANIHSHSTKIPKKNLFAKVIYSLKQSKILIKVFLSKEKYNKFRAKFLETITERPSGLDKRYKKQLFDKYYKEDVLKLEKLLSRDLSIWK